jgi:signal transduction histidine kinase
LIEDKKIIVEDTWPGIALEDQNRIWTRFWKKNTTTNEWYGLGLYMVKLLIEKLWWSITVKSIPNTWTSFIIHLE